MNEIFSDTALVLTRHKLDVDAFYRMSNAGIIGKHDRIELIGGELIDMAPIGEDHYGIVNILTERLVLACLGRATVSVQSPLHVDRSNDPQPDFTIFRGQTASYRDQVAKLENALLVIEVADSSLQYDRSVKTLIYGKAGIPEYWIVDLSNKRVLLHRQPGPEGYRDVTTFAPGTRLRLTAAAEIVLDLGALFL